MTKAREGAWASCPVTLRNGTTCGNRMRATSERCSRCYAREYERERWQRTKREQHERQVYAEQVAGAHSTVNTEALARQAQAEATANEHDVQLGRDTTEDLCYVGVCSKCERFLCVDIMAEDVDGTVTPVYGRVTEGTCPGKPDIAAVSFNQSTLDLMLGGGNAMELDQRRDYAGVGYTAIANYPLLAED